MSLNSGALHHISGLPFGLELGISAPHHNKVENVSMRSRKNWRVPGPRSKVFWRRVADHESWKDLLKRILRAKVYELSKAT